MIDIHCHILPGIDDGAQSEADSIALAKEAVKQGIKKIVASPHHRTSKYDNPKHEIKDLVTSVNGIFQREGIPLEVLLGQEVRVFGELISEFTDDYIATINEKNYLLVEFPSNHVPSYSERLFYDLQMHGITPVIVHPERNSQIIEQPDKLYQLIEKGAISQVTAASVAGAFGKKIQKFSLQLIEANLCHIVASDAHNVTNRSFKMDEAFEKIEKEFSIDHSYMYRENAELIVAGKMIYKENPEKIKRKKLLGIF
ncbi:tyrosine-protein phosphatase [Bacillus kwashiorkori]|uniref:tyrosine-protein phosphatase n=1 Tax=Bacillus kwashiorkori TaxID=1522318 RepID=UPI0007815A66|nr:CpsB/CapC family capsule biosynthesis tyrosine phosphatase [Bacillus kwashiorkori]